MKIDYTVPRLLPLPGTRVLELRTKLVQLTENQGGGIGLAESVNATLGAHERQAELYLGVLVDLAGNHYGLESYTVFCFEQPPVVNETGGTTRKVVLADDEVNAILRFKWMPLGHTELIRGLNARLVLGNVARTKALAQKQLQVTKGSLSVTGTNDATFTKKQ